MNPTRSMHTPTWSTLTLLIALSSCLPEDTRPPPAQVTTSLSLAPQLDDDLANGLSFDTADGYTVTLESMRMSFGRVRFEGDDCAAYGRSIGDYLRIIDPLQTAPQPLSVSYALGTCTMKFGLYPPEDWASVDNAGITENDRSALRGISFPDPESSVGLESTDGLAGPRGPRGASLVVHGRGQPHDEEQSPIEFSLAFQVASEPPPCTAPFELAENNPLTLTIEMAPEQLFGTCDGPLVFGPLALAASLQPAETVIELSNLSEISLEQLQQFPSFDRLDCSESSTPNLEEPPTTVGAITEDSEATPATNYQIWLQQRVQRHLFAVREATCQ